MVFKKKVKAIPTTSTIPAASRTDAPTPDGDRDDAQNDAFGDDLGGHADEQTESSPEAAHTNNADVNYTPACTPQELIYNNEQSLTRDADLTHVAEAVSRIAEDGRDRGQAWNHLKQLEQFYRKFTERVFDLKMREIDALQETIEDETHMELVSDLCQLEDRRIVWLQSAKSRMQHVTQSAESCMEASIGESNIQFVNKRSEARQIMYRRLYDVKRQLDVDWEQSERSRLGKRIKAMKHLFPQHSSITPPKELDGELIFNSNAVDQFVWQSKRNDQMLEVYESTLDRFDARVPPRVSPCSLTQAEIVEDMQKIRNAELILRDHCLPKGEPKPHPYTLPPPYPSSQSGFLRPPPFAMPALIREESSRQSPVFF